MIKTQFSFLDFRPQEKVPNSIGLICFRATDWRTGKITKIHTVVYLIKTITSLLFCVDNVIVYVCEDGLDFIASLFDNVIVKKIEVPKEYDFNNGEIKIVKPVGKYALLHNDWVAYDYVFFTESDHVIYSRSLKDIVQQLDDCQYLSAHRFELKHKQYNQHGQPIIIFDGHQYVLYNEYNEDFTEYGSNFVLAKTYKASYSAAWIAKSGALKKVDFDRFGNKALHCPCLATFDTLQCLKTKFHFDFFVDHLSGFDNALKEAGLDIAMFPGRW